MQTQLDDGKEVAENDSGCFNLPEHILTWLDFLFFTSLFSEIPLCKLILYWHKIFQKVFFSGNVIE